MKILNEILEDVKIIESHGNLDACVSSISLDSRKIEINSCFVAISGNVIDGHTFIDEVIEKGASVVIYEKNIKDFKSGVTYIKVEDTHSVIGQIANNFYGDPSRKLKLIGVTGTNGKTTTVTLLHELFRNLGYKVGMIGTIVNKINDETFEATRTTPDAITLNELFLQMVDAGCKYCFMEVSSHAVCEKRIEGVSFFGGIFTNLTLDHLDYHKTFENYTDAKKTFFDMIRASGFAIANIDDKKGEYMLSTTKAHTYTLSLKKDADFTERLKTKLIGEFNAYNILGIYACAILLGQDEAKSSEVQSSDSFMKEFEGKVKKIIETLEPVVGRFQYIKSDNKITGIVDYAHTPDALENVLRTINDMKGNGRVITVIGCGGDRDKTKRPIMAKIGYDMSDILILTSDNPRTEKPEDILNDMQKGLSLDDLDKVEIIIDRHMAIEKACTLATSGDFILVAGKGHEKYQEINGQKTHFDDMEELSRFLS